MKQTLMIFFCLATLTAGAQTSPAYRRDALQLVKIQERVLKSADDPTKCKALMRVESSLLLKFSKKYQTYFVHDLIPTSNMLLGTADNNLALMSGAKDPRKRKEMAGQALTPISEARRLIDLGK